MKTANMFGLKPWEDGIEPDVVNEKVRIWILKDMTKSLRTTYLTNKPIEGLANSFVGKARFIDTDEESFVFFDENGAFDEAFTFESACTMIDKWKLLHGGVA